MTDVTTKEPDARDIELMREVIQLAEKEVKAKGLPFATLIVDSQGRVVSRTVNRVAQTFDPTDHAELLAIREVTRAIRSPSLKGYKVYIIGHPCPMCLAALLMARPDKVYFAASLEEKEAALKSHKGRMDLYAEMAKPAAQRFMAMEQIVALRDEAIRVYQAWDQAMRR